MQWTVVSGGRIVSIDDAYVRAAKVTVATDVSGIVAQVAVHEGQEVHAGDILYRLDDRPFRIALEGASAMRAQTVLDITAMKHDYQRLLHEAEARVATRAETDDARFKLAADQPGVEGLRVQG